MLRADILVDGVKFCVPTKVVCMGVPSGDGLALMSGEVSMLVGWVVGVANTDGNGAELLPDPDAAAVAGICFLFSLLISA